MCVVRRRSVKGATGREEAAGKRGGGLLPSLGASLNACLGGSLDLVEVDANVVVLVAALHGQVHGRLVDARRLGELA